MVEEENSNQKNLAKNNSEESVEAEKQNIEIKTKQNFDDKEKISPDDKIKELEEKLTRTFAEMENQRRRFEKEKDDAFDYGGFSFAKEALNLIDKLARSKLILASDETLK